MPFGLKIRKLRHEATQELLHLIFRYGWYDVLPRLISSRLECAYIRAMSPALFGEEFYLERNQDVAESRWDPLLHYVRYGSAEGRIPHPLVDEAHYRHVSELGRSARISALGHYLARGSRQGLTLAPWFDPAFYAEANPGLRVARMDPFEHFVRIGAARGYAPSADPAAQELVRHRLEAAARGSVGGDPTRPAEDDPQPGNEFLRASRDRPAPSEAAAVEAALAALAGLAPTASGHMPVVDVVIPVYGGRVETLTCLLRVLTARNRTPAEIVAIDDATPDPVLADCLSDLARRGLVTLIVNDCNRGFVHSVNRGMALHPDRDVVWLNADTEVFGDWIDRLRAAAYRRDRIATVTPFTNNGTICSYPRANSNNLHPIETGWAELDALAAEENRGLAAEIPTAVGFATYVRRDAIAEIGPLDEAAFGHGYGEENDFCQRGRAKGWKDILAADVFVRHVGATSFGASRTARAAAARAVLRRRHPDYFPSVRRFVAGDPVAALRRRLDRARLLRLAGARNVLIVSHGRGGGSQKHVAQEIRRLKREGASVYLMTSDQGGRMTATLGHVDCAACPSFQSLRIEHAEAELTGLFREIGITELHIHHLIDFPISAPQFFGRLARHLGARMDFTVHDHFPVCPRVNLVGRSGRYCGEPGPEGCRACLISGVSGYGVPEIGAWRANYRTLLASAQSVLVPSRDTKARLLRYFPDLGNVVHQPFEEVTPAPLAAPSGGARLRIGTIGAVSTIKGFEVLLRCADHARRRQAPADFVVVGYTENDAEARRRSIEVTGRYSDEVALEHVARAELDMVFLPSICPETHCYTLSIALQTGLPIAAFDLGAIAERLQGRDRAILLPLDMAGRPSDLVRALIGGFHAVHSRGAGTGTAG